MKDLFFFYGTLRLGCPISTVVLKNAKYITTITLQGKLYLTKDKYPLFVPGKEGLVIGDIFEVPASLIDQLDEYEEINSPHSPYERVKFNKNNITFWVYAAKKEFSKKLNELKVIPSGDWLNYIKQHRKNSLFSA
ncbi:gamma-glutamylcyclotransferase [Deferribacter autotrophicus]|uniref:Gamma-glutamylcyclotransferase n=1 Tax=Deferribacter autotrophicus TaxID=500465 RepID=A0A5A8F6J6_9BACT|nr:gamma-glutamylcyclotransferase family protein [Deferribacter autotrophicus]KAA0259230.1 gamma-glutamylcyclotransferase [Deferribacter autotrophicus]